MKHLQPRFAVIAVILLCVSAAWAAPERARGKHDPSVFDGPPAEPTPFIFSSHESSGGVLRVLTVEERVGRPRRNELVRVPLFFHEDECADPDGLVVVPAEGPKTPVPYQADDIRRDASGKVARMHAYFLVDLEPWQRKQFHVMAGANPGAKAEPVAVSTADDTVTFTGEDLRVSFYTSGDRGGAINAIQTRIANVTLVDGFVGPAIKLIRQSRDLKTVRENEVSYVEADKLDIRDIRWASGPLFAKMVVRLGPAGQPDNAEYTYLIPRHGSEFTISQRLFPSETDTTDTVGAKGNSLIKGRFFVGDSAQDQQIVGIPAGLRQRTRGVFKFTNPAMVNAQSGISMLVIPYVQMGLRGITTDDAGYLNVNGSLDFRRKGGSNSERLKMWWGQARFIFTPATDTEELWKLSTEKFQPLTAIVDEPWATVEEFERLTRQVNASFWNIKYWGRPFEAELVMSYLSGKDVSKMLAKQEANRPPTLEGMIPTVESIQEAAKKGQGAGGLDPYNITYSRSAMALYSALIQPSERLDLISELVGDASRLVNGTVNKYGNPHVKSFANAANMHQGTYLMGLWGGRKRGNHDLVQWCLDATQNQALMGTYGHGQRPYTINPGAWEPSDVLYISITDLWLRAIELACDEDLNLHPSIYGRYHDMIDVNANLYQQSYTNDKGKLVESWDRAAMLRGQAHDHRWEGFGCDPFLAPLANAADGGRVGITEACYYMHRKVGKEVGWNTLMTDVFFPYALITRGVKDYRPAPRPPLPANVKTQVQSGGVLVTWDAVPGANIRGYRVYRAEDIGGPYTWVNSPYPKMDRFQPPTRAQRPPAPKAPKKGEPAPPPPPPAEPYDFVVPKIPDTLIKETRFLDPEGTAESVYFVTAVDADHRESRWFDDEPLPKPSR